MSLYYPLSPVHRLCAACQGYGHRPDGGMCLGCDGIGRVWMEGGPGFGCKMTLAGRKVGEIVTLGNMDRGRVVRHSKRGTPSTDIVLIDPLFDTEDARTTNYPSSTGVLSTMPANAQSEDTHGRTRSRQDQLDPLQRETRPL